MKIIDILKQPKPVFSFEFFPPKTTDGMTQLLKTFEELKTLNPGYISVTYGAGGSTSDRTIEVLNYAKNVYGFESMAHLTCVGHSSSEIQNILGKLIELGIENILALRGDPPSGEDQFTQHSSGFKYAKDLSCFIHKIGNFSVAVAGYPEGHIEAKSKKDDWNYLLEKIEMGAEFIITQLFFDNTKFFEFKDFLTSKGVKIPIIPGIMPITNYHQILKFTKLCGATIPIKLENDLFKVQDDNLAVSQYGMEYCINQCEELLSSGVPSIHFYTLNKIASIREIITAISR